MWRLDGVAAEEQPRPRSRGWSARGRSGSGSRPRAGSARPAAARRPPTRAVVVPGRGCAAAASSAACTAGRGRAGRRRPRAARGRCRRGRRPWSGSCARRPAGRRAPSRRRRRWSAPRPPPPGARPAAAGWPRCRRAPACAGRAGSRRDGARRPASRPARRRRPRRPPRCRAARRAAATRPSRTLAWSSATMMRSGGSAVLMRSCLRLAGAAPAPSTTHWPSLRPGVERAAEQPEPLAHPGQPVPAVRPCSARAVPGCRAAAVAASSVADRQPNAGVVVVEADRRRADRRACLAALTRASCATRSSATVASGGSGRGSPAVSKADRDAVALARGSLGRPWPAPRAAAGVSVRSACTARRVSVSPSAAIRWAAVEQVDGPVDVAVVGQHDRAAWIWMPSAPREWASTSWISRAIRVRSSSRSARRCSAWSCSRCASSAPTARPGSGRRRGCGRRAARTPAAPGSRAGW